MVEHEHLSLFGPGECACTDQEAENLALITRYRAAKVADSQVGRENFAVICCRFDRMDWLKLGLTGHRRARFFWWEDRLDASWVVP